MSFNASDRPPWMRTALLVLRIAVTLLFPPVGVFFKVGLTGHFFLSLILTFFGYVPGLIHAVWVYFKYSKR